MSFIWPAMLVLLLVLPLLVALYIRMQRRRQRIASQYGSMGLVQQANGSSRRVGLRRHLPAVLFLIGLTLLTVALARPQAVVSLPRVQGTVILTFDVSGSMAANDIAPTRMEAAKAAATEFVKRQPVTVQIGVVSFSESGFSAQTPTNDQAAILAAINRLAPTRGTSLANGIQAALNTIAAMDAEESTNYYSNRPADPDPTPVPTPTPVPPGVHVPAAIVLITDGENTVSPDPLEAAHAAAERGVRIHTVGIGSAAGATLNVEGFSVHTQLDEATLQQISQLTEGNYYNAQTDKDFRAIYDNLGAQLMVKSEETEVTSIVAGLGLLALLIGGGLSLWWFSRLP